MYKKAACFIFCIVFLFQTGLAQETCSIIPLPVHCERVNETFRIAPQTAVIVKEEAFSHAAYFFKNQLLHYTGIPLASNLVDNSAIVLQKDSTLKLPVGGYTIDMQANKVTITAAGKKGIFNGVVSLLQLALHAKQKHDTLFIPSWNIKDYPLYTWRGVMLDVSRHFFGVEVIKDILDQMALLKLNRFHWHLTDGTGWRIQINEYPRLALVGGIGNKTDSLAPAQYYTQQEIREVVAYAKARHIKVIPEIEMPGHATAANRAYPQYSGGGTGEYANFTFNPGLRGTYRYLTNILQEVAVLFPSGMVHLGGDEVSYGNESWKTLPAVEDLMQKHDLKDLKAVEHYFVRTMVDSALNYFNKVIAWDEAVDAGIPTDSTIIYWWRQNKPEQLGQALEAGYHVVMCPRLPLYFDFVQHRSHQQGRRWGGNFNTLKDVYQFSIHTYPVAEQAPQLILGIQANLWTETVQTEKRLEFLLFPRIAALAEAAWTKPQSRNYKAFLKRLQKQFTLWEQEDIYYFNPLAPEKTPEVIDKF